MEEEKNKIVQDNQKGEISNKIAIMIMLTSILLGMFTTAGIGFYIYRSYQVGASSSEDTIDRPQKTVLNIYEGEILWPDGTPYYRGELIKGDMKEVYRELYEKDHEEIAKYLKEDAREFSIPEFIGEGVPHGEGKLYSKDGTLEYEGGFQYGKKEGEGKWYTAKGALIYAGEYKNGEAHGKGTTYWNDGVIMYQGEFREGSPVEGIGYYPDGTVRYEGFTNEEGIFYWDNFRYEGELLSGFPDGKGKTYDADGNLVYEGHYTSMKRNGYGKQYYTNNGGVFFEGEYIDDKASKGKLYREDGSLAYDGQIKDDMIHGEGKGYFLDGSTYEGRWQENIPIDLAAVKADSFYEEDIIINGDGKDTSDVLETLALLKAGADLYPETAPSAYFNIAMLLFDIEEYDEGINYIINSAKLDSRQAFSTFSTATYILKEKGLSSKVNALLQKAIELDPSNSIVYRSLIE